MSNNRGRKICNTRGRLPGDYGPLINQSERGVLSQPYNKYLLLHEFEGRTVNYGPRFSRVGQKSKGKNKGLQFTVRTEKTRLVRYLSLYLFILEYSVQKQSFRIYRIRSAQLNNRSARTT